MDADQLSEHWYDERQARGLDTDAYHRLRQGLRDFLPTDALAGIGYVEAEPVAIAFDRDNLQIFSPPVENLLLDLAVVPVANITGLNLTNEFVGNVEANYRSCAWTIAIPMREVPVIETRRPVGAGFGTDNGGEQVMAEFAEKLGLQLPASWGKQE